MKDRATKDRWHGLLNTITGHGTLGVIAMALVITFACVLSGADAATIYALVALVLAFAVLIAVAVILLGGRDVEEGRTNEPPR
jgi:hypothetical protein